MEDYTWELVDDGTMDTVIRVTLIQDSDIGKEGETHILRFDSECVRSADGCIDEDAMVDELETWADQIVASRI